MENGGGDLEAKIEMLLNVEKQMRQVGDVAGTRKAVTPLAILLLTPQTIPLIFSLQESQSRRRRGAAVLWVQIQERKTLLSKENQEKQWEGGETEREGGLKLWFGITLVLDIQGTMPETLTKKY
ncbi:uncharacterized protein LOC105160109 [Sesamum indicum]|uniref:Uncharacterized protein LOC105160109 n=1 Tax=Sesamum indicum TaxID=4182 RepID=A0A8M8UQI2_SESIN|nr:uncharacterized protein LOC105160109 [Sesamum indicum]